MAKTLPAKSEWVAGDFNGMLEENLLCLSHSNIILYSNGQELQLRAGLQITAYEDDEDEFGNPDALIASGVVERSPVYAQCRGSKWSLRIDVDGIRHQSELEKS